MASIATRCINTLPLVHAIMLRHRSNHQPASRPTRTVPSWVALLLTSFVLWVGCDTSFDPFTESGMPYSIYGRLTLSDSPDFIRVKAIDALNTPEGSRSLDAAVTLNNLTAGTSEVLQDSIVVFDGVYTHNFRVSQDIQPGATYQLTAEAPDGRTTHATATMPLLASTEVTIEGEPPCGEYSTVLIDFRNLAPGERIEVKVEVDWERGTRWVPLPNDVELPAGGSGGTIFRPYAIIEQVVSEQLFESVSSPCELLEGNAIRVAYTHYGPDWPADTTIADPIKSNTTNGLGLFGGLRRDTLSVTVSGALSP